VQIVSANNLELGDVKKRFGLQWVQEPDFFCEWQQPFPQIEAAGAQWLDRIKTDFLSLAEYLLHKEIVKMFVLAPLLMLAGLSRPLVPQAEYLVEVAFEDEELGTIRGRVDLLVLH